MWTDPDTDFLQPAGMGTDLTLSCDVSANPTATIVWYGGEDPQEITTGTDGNNLTLSYLQEPDYANYTCTATNIILGQVYSESFNFSVVLGPGPPGPVVNLSVVNVTSVDVTLEWTSSWSGDMPEDPTFQLQYQEVGSGESPVAVGNIPWVEAGSYRVVTASDLENHTDYQFSVTATNTYHVMSSSVSAKVEQETNGEYP